MYFKRTNINEFNDIELYSTSLDAFTSSTHSQKKNWLKEKNLYKFREGKKFLASPTNDDT